MWSPYTVLWAGELSSGRESEGNFSAGISTGIKIIALGSSTALGGWGVEWHVFLSDFRWDNQDISPVNTEPNHNCTIGKLRCRLCSKGGGIFFQALSQQDIDGKMGWLSSFALVPKEALTKSRMSKHLPHARFSWTRLFERSKGGGLTFRFPKKTQSVPDHRYSGASA